MQQRMTKQRKAILNYIKSIRTHPTAEDIHAALCKEIPSMSLGTVYRNLQVLSESNHITKLEINNEFHFDGFTHNHIHAVCDVCKRIIDFEDKSIDKKILSKLPSKDFSPENILIIVSGTCSSCQNNKKQKNLVK